MNHWTFVLAAYAIFLVGVAALVGFSWLSMRRFEAQAEQVRRG